MERSVLFNYGCFKGIPNVAVVCPGGRPSVVKALLSTECLQKLGHETRYALGFVNPFEPVAVEVKLGEWDVSCCMFTGCEISIEPTVVDKLRRQQVGSLKKTVRWGSPKMQLPLQS